MEIKTGKKLSIELLKKVDKRKDDLIVYAPYTLGLDAETILESAVIGKASHILETGINNDIFLGSGNMRVFSWYVNGVLTCQTAGKKSLVRMENFLSENLPLYDVLYRLNLVDEWLNRYEYHIARILAQADKSDGKGGDAFECATRDILVPSGKKYNRHAPEKTVDAKPNKSIMEIILEMLEE